jgi:hypothetical protein
MGMIPREVSHSLEKSLPMSYANVCKIDNIYLNTSGVFDLGYTLNKEKILTLYMLSTTWKDSDLVC